MNCKEIIQSREDLSKLDAQYKIDIVGAYLLVYDVPYVNSGRNIFCGVLVSELAFAGNTVQKPNDHVCLFQAEHCPCNENGVELNGIINDRSQRELFENFEIQFSFSSKPNQGYEDYFLKMTSYINILASHARAIDSSVTAKRKV